MRFTRRTRWAAAATVLGAGALALVLHTFADGKDTTSSSSAWQSPYSAPGASPFGDPARKDDHTKGSWGRATLARADAGSDRRSHGTSARGAAPASSPPASGGQPSGTASPVPEQPNGSPAPAVPTEIFDAYHMDAPPSVTEDLFRPLTGAKTRGVAISEWESYRTDAAGKNIVVTTDDSNFFRDRNGKLNGNTGDTDASGLNITDATDSTVLGTESADEAPWQTVAQAMVDVQTSQNDGDTDEDAGDEDASDAGASPADATTLAVSDKSGTSDAAFAAPAASATPGAAAAVVTPPQVGDEDTEDQEDDDSDDGDDTEAVDFPYLEWTQRISSDRASAIHTDDGTTLASGADALTIGGDGYDDDDNRALGENLVITRDDGNVVLGGTGDVNAQIGDSEQGAVIMDVNRTNIKGGGAY
jgi:hypothetical protein